MTAVISVDFWNTLYVLNGSGEYRRATRSAVVARLWAACGIGGAPAIADALFPEADRFVHACWADGRPPTEASVIDHLFGYLAGKVERTAIAEALEAVADLLTAELTPQPLPGALDFLEWAASRGPLYLISDTYMSRGRTLDRVLAKHGVLDLFAGRIYSDEFGAEKPNTRAIEHIISVERVAADRIVHIGDLENRDGELARRSGCSCILIDASSAGRHAASYPDMPHVLAACRSFDEARRALKEADC